MVESIGKGYKPWLIASVAVLVASLLLLACVVGIGFFEFGQASTPLWVIILGVLAILGILAGFGGFFLLMAFAGLQSFRNSRKVQVLPPAGAADDPAKSAM